MSHPARSTRESPDCEPGKARGPRHGQYKHGMFGHPLYGTWNLIRHRCENPRHRDYRYYGGSGIRLCERWHDVAAFVKDIEAGIGPRPEGQYPSGRPMYTLDRIDNNGHYSCGHCGECTRNGWTANSRWATKSEQGVNRRRSSANTSGYRGVSWMRREGYWMAYITVGGRRKYLGRFDDPVEAARAYNAAALEAWGEGVWLNPIPDAAEPPAA